MIKKFCVLFLALTVLFSSCQKETKSLAKPDAIVLEQTSSSFTVAWQAVEGATNYVYTLDGAAEQTTTETIVTYNELETSIYTFAVKATGNGAESEWTELVITLTPSSEDGFAIQINAKDVEATTATVEFIPSDSETQYFARVITTAELETLNITDDVALIQYLYENPNQADYVYSGTQSLELERLSPNYEYLAVAFEYLAPEEIKTIYKKTFVTKDQVVDHSMTISNLTPDYTGVTFTVTPGNDEEYWFYYCMEKSLYDEFGENVMIYTYYGMQNHAFELGYTSGMGEMLQALAQQGEGQVVATDLKHSTDYVAMAFYVDPNSTDPTNIYDWSYVSEEFTTLTPTNEAPVITIADPIIKYEEGVYSMIINVNADASTTVLSYGTADYASCAPYIDQGWEAIKAFFWLHEIPADQLAAAKTQDGIDFVYNDVPVGNYVFLIEAKNAQGATTYEGVVIDSSLFN